MIGRQPSCRVTRKQLDTALMKIGRDVGMGTAEGIRAFLRGEIVVSRPIRLWREEDGVIYFSVTSDGTTSEGWITRLESEYFVPDCIKQVLRSPDFMPTNGVTTEVAVLKGMLFKDKDRVGMTKIYAEANNPQAVQVERRGGLHHPSQVHTSPQLGHQASL